MQPLILKSWLVWLGVSWLGKDYITINTAITKPTVPNLKHIRQDCRIGI